MRRLVTLLLLYALPCTVSSSVNPAGGPSVALRQGPRPYVPARPSICCLYKGRTLKHSVHRWAQSAGWTLQWPFPYDYPILVTTCFKGGFSQAIQAVTQAYSQAEHPFYLDLYPQQRLVIIGDQNHENS